jgi:hypothetical protein
MCKRECASIVGGQVGVCVCVDREGNWSRLRVSVGAQRKRKSRECCCYFAADENATAMLAHSTRTPISTREDTYLRWTAPGPRSTGVRTWATPASQGTDAAQAPLTSASPQLQSFARCGEQGTQAN